MSTNASVAKLQKNGSVKEITVHYDGYIEGVGTTLNYFYQDQNKIDKLLSLGEISSLGDEPEVAPCLAKYGDKAFDNKYAVSQESDENDNEIQTHTIAYHRDRGEELSIYIHDSLDDYYASVNDDIFLEFCYINIDNVWYVKTMVDDEGHKSRLQLLSDLVNEAEQK